MTPQFYLHIEKSILECLGDTITSLLLLLPSPSVILRKKRFECNATLQSLFIVLLRSIPFFIEKKLFIIFYYTHCVMVMSKRNKISFQCYVHDAMIMKKLFTLNFIKNNCYYVHYAATMTKKYIFLFQHYYIHCNVMMKKKHFFLYC